MHNWCTYKTIDARLMQNRGKSCPLFMILFFNEKHSKTIFCFVNIKDENVAIKDLFILISFILLYIFFFVQKCLQFFHLRTHITGITQREKEEALLFNIYTVVFDHSLGKYTNSALNGWVAKRLLWMDIYEACTFI